MSRHTFVMVDQVMERTEEKLCNGGVLKLLLHLLCLFVQCIRKKQLALS